MENNNSLNRKIKDQDSKKSHGAVTTLKANSKSKQNNDNQDNRKSKKGILKIIKGGK